MHTIDRKIGSPDLEKIRENTDFGKHSENYEKFLLHMKVFRSCQNSELACAHHH